MNAIAIATATTVADQEDGTVETTEAAVVDTATIVEEMEALDTEAEIGVVRWTIEVIAEAIEIITTVGEEATDTTTIVDAVEETTFAEDAIGRPIGEDLPGAVGTIGDAVVLEADHHHVAEITAETTEEEVEVEVTLEVLLEGAMMIVTGVATMITEVVAVTMRISAIVLQRCTAETIVEETIAVIVDRDLFSKNHSFLLYLMLRSKADFSLF